jgi:hypothetical protein
MQQKPEGTQDIDFPPLHEVGRAGWGQELALDAAGVV